MYLKRRKFYLAGGLFNLAERQRNARLERAFRAVNREVILPQREALRFFQDGVLDLDAVAQACRLMAEDEENICIVCLDGPDADPGAAIEYMAAIGKTGRAVTYRSDFRTAPEKELGRNAMFRLPVTEFVYLPCYAVEEYEVELFYSQLAEEIEKAVSRLGLG